MILIIDNYDSFTYNLVQYLRMLGAEVLVHRNDEIDVPTLETLAPAGIVISSGPGHPASAGVSLDIITTFMGRIPILGVGLGHLAIVHALDGEIVPVKTIMHGKTSRIRVIRGEGLGARDEGRETLTPAPSPLTPRPSPLFDSITGPFEAMCYHSLVADRDTLPPQLIVTAESEDDGEIMAVRHRDYPLEGLQFHPESIMTIIGKRLLRNFLNGCGGA